MLMSSLAFGPRSDAVMSLRAVLPLVPMSVTVPVLGQVQLPLPSEPPGVAKPAPGPMKPRVSSDVELLQRAGVGIEPAALLELLRNHSRTDTDAARLEMLIGRLGDEDYDRRE